MSAGNILVILAMIRLPLITNSHSVIVSTVDTKNFLEFLAL